MKGAGKDPKVGHARPGFKVYCYSCWLAVDTTGKPDSPSLAILRPFRASASAPRGSWQQKAFVLRQHPWEARHYSQESD